MRFECPVLIGKIAGSPRYIGVFEAIRVWQRECTIGRRLGCTPPLAGSRSERVERVRIERIAHDAIQRLHICYMLKSVLTISLPNVNCLSRKAGGGFNRQGLWLFGVDRFHNNAPISAVRRLQTNKAPLL